MDRHARSQELPVDSDLANYLPSRIDPVSIMAEESASHVPLGAVADATAQLPLHLLDGACIALHREVHSSLKDKDTWFWQFPCRTEEAAWERHRALPGPVAIGEAVNVYLGLPWATWIDCQYSCREDIAIVNERVTKLRAWTAERGLSFRLHTVCQHIYWQAMLPAFRLLGVKDLWLSHAPPERHLDRRLQIWSWPLYAVNVEDPARREGLTFARRPDERTKFASFRGAWMPHYLSSVRLRLAEYFGRRARADDAWIVEMTSKWHFEDIVYRHQVAGRALADIDTKRAETARYNELISDSVFSLCPSGAGPNTLRLWESLAVGCIPVVLSDSFRPPQFVERAGEYSPTWQEAVLTHPEDALATLEERLRALTPEERRRMHLAAIRLYAAARGMRCF